MNYKLSKSNKTVHGEITLNGSKSLSNRVLIIRALCDQHFSISNLSTSRDTQLLHQLLQSKSNILDAEAAGTTFRFLTAYYAFKEGTIVLTGTERMKQRPIGILVAALNEIGADIHYLEKDGFPPLQINSPKTSANINHLVVKAEMSSQYISALLMIAPTLPAGLQIELEGTTVSRPYIDMTLQLMKHFGIQHEWKNSTIRVPPQKYQPNDFIVEADWSAASYYYSLAALSDDCEIRLNGLFENSMQGDAVLPVMMKNFGVKTEFEGKVVILSKESNDVKPVFEWNFLPCPDLAQTLAVVCGGLGVQGLLSGLHTLRIKETDRILALQNELAKVRVSLSKLPSRFIKNSTEEFYLLEGKAGMPGAPIFSTYEDHRMAMAFAPLSLLGDIEIEHPEVVNKSYPAFWEDLKTLGFEIDEIQAE